MQHFLLVGVGGFIGSMLRFGLSGLAHRWVQNGFPVGTLAVNALGCLAVGAVWSLVESRQWPNPELQVFLTAGILGGFTHVLRVRPRDLRADPSRSLFVGRGQRAGQRDPWHRRRDRGLDGG